MALWSKNKAGDPFSPSEDGFSARIGKALQASPMSGDSAEAALAVGPRGEALAAIDEALSGLAHAKAALGTAAKLVIDAAGREDLGERALLAERYEDAKAAIDGLGGETAPRLLRPGGRLLVSVGRLDYAVEPFILSTGPDALDLPAPAEGFATHADVAVTLKQVELALERLAKAERGFARDRDRLSRGFTAGLRGAA